MNETTFPVHASEVAVREHKRTLKISIASSSPGAHKPANIVVSQEMDMVRLKIDVPRYGDWSGVCHALLLRENAEALCHDLAERLGLKVVERNPL